LIRSMSATDVPPNFCTMRAITFAVCWGSRDAPSRLSAGR
jgi:hypothetical protein